MPVEMFTNELGPTDKEAVIWRLMELWTLEDLLKTRVLVCTYNFFALWRKCLGSTPCNYGV
jgi:hypothetical protein